MCLCVGLSIRKAAFRDSFGTASSLEDFHVTQPRQPGPQRTSEMFQEVGTENARSFLRNAMTYTNREGVRGKESKER